jgi:hypothetical protein
VAAAVGGHRKSSDEYFKGWQIEASTIECAIADVMALIRATAEATDNDEYDLGIGINWTGEITWDGGQPLTILAKDNMGYAYDGVSTPLHSYTPVATTVNAVESDLDYYWHVHDLAQDCVNQGGISNVLLIQPPARDNQA